MNFKLISSGIVVLALAVLSYFWMHADHEKHAVTERQLAEANNAVPTAAGTPQQQAAPIKTAPPAAVAAPVATTQPQQVNKAPAPEAEPEKKSDSATDLPPEELAAIRQELKTSVETQFKDKLSFPLDEEKMITYTMASLKVKKINNKWDVQIAGADKDATAIEYNNLAVEEITKSMQSLKGITVDQYNEMTKLTATDKDFSRLYQVYKQLIEDGVIKPEPTVAAIPASVPVMVAPPIAQQAIQQPVQAAVPATLAAAPVNRGTAPVPQGSPARPYSPQPSR